MNTIVGQFINGEHVKGGSDKSIDIINPANEKNIGTLNFAGEKALQHAVDSAASAFSEWGRTSPLKRARILFKYKALLEKHQKEIATIISNEHGKTLDDAKGEVIRAIEVVELNCGIPSKLQGDFSASVASNIDTHTMRQPLGVCAGVSPFNFPVMVPTWMMIPAIACGNTFILKPSEQDPTAPIRLVELLHEAGLPPGVVNIVNGDKSAVDFLLTNKTIQAITAVASTPVAEYIYQNAAQNGKRSHTFGGAKNHCLVMPDANIKSAAQAISGAAFGAAGERCMALSVAVVIGDKTADNLIAALKTEIDTIKVGPGLGKDNDMGPLINKPHFDKVKNYIASGVDEGATLVADGRTLSLSPGYFLGPTLFDHVKSSMRIYQEEIFGPVLVVVRVSSFEEGLTLINQHQYGNGTAIFTHDGLAAREFSDKVQAGMVGVNIPIPVPVAYHPFGGWKQSVFGNTNMHGNESVHFYTKLKTVTTKWIKDEHTEKMYVMPTHD